MCVDQKRRACFIGKDKPKTTSFSGDDGIPAAKLAIGPKQHVLYATRELALDLANKIGCLLTGDGLSSAQFAGDILPGLINKSQYRPIPFFAPVFGVMPFATALQTTV